MESGIKHAKINNSFKDAQPRVIFLRIGFPCYIDQSTRSTVSVQLVLINIKQRQKDARSIKRYKPDGGSLEFQKLNCEYTGHGKMFRTNRKLTTRKNPTRAYIFLSIVSISNFTSCVLPHYFVKSYRMHEFYFRDKQMTNYVVKRNYHLLNAIWAHTYSNICLAIEIYNEAGWWCNKKSV